MWKLASYEWSGTSISRSGKCTAQATRRMRLKGKGRVFGATDSILSKIPSRTA